MLYAQAKFGRGPLAIGMGFGNRLFPWARYRIFVHVNSAQGIAPVWMRPAISQLFRGGIDYHAYTKQLVLWGLFRHSPGELGAVDGALRSCFAASLPEPPSLAVPIARPAGNAKVIFREAPGNFAPLNGWNDFILRELRAITRPRYLEVADLAGPVEVGICIRCGNDFKQPAPGATRLGGAEKTPVSWFVSCLELVRRVAGRDVHAAVVSDGTRAQLAPILELPNVSFVRPGSAVSDLLVLAKARVLLVSGASSFAAWGSFLSQAPTASHLGQPVTWWQIAPTKGQYLGELDPAAASHEFLDQARRWLAA